MKRLEQILTITLVLIMVTTTAKASVSIIKNSNFEYDGRISNLADKAPYMWFDVDIPDNRFAASIVRSQLTYGQHALRLATEGWNDFESGEMITVSQQVTLQDVNEITFDIRLDTFGDMPWDSEKRSVVLLIDGQQVWELPETGSDIRGTYLNNVYEVDELYKDDTLRTISLGLLVNIDGESLVDYEVDWDFIKFDTYCGGFGYLPADFNRDCYVDYKDLAILAQAWLTEDAESLSYAWVDSDSTVTLEQYAAFAAEYMYNSDWTNHPDASFIAQPLPVQDLTESGAVEVSDLKLFLDDWMETDDGLRTDFDRSRTVDFRDFAIFAEGWGKVNWLYQPN